MYENFEFLITSPYDREKLVCEIYYNGVIFAELSQETGELIIEIYAAQQTEWWQFSFTELQAVLEHAKAHLKGEGSL